MPPTASILILAAHPRRRFSLVNHALVEAAEALAREGAGPALTVCDLYATYPDMLIDARAEQARLVAADLVVWQHPIHWFGMPPLMKQWLDEVLTLHWAHGPGGSALQGKRLWVVASTPRREDRRVWWPAYERIAQECGMHLLEPFILEGLRERPRLELDLAVQSYRQRLMSYPHWPELASPPPSATEP